MVIMIGNLMVCLRQTSARKRRLEQTLLVQILVVASRDGATGQVVGVVGLLLAPVLRSTDRWFVATLSRVADIGNLMLAQIERWQACCCLSQTAGR